MATQNIQLKDGNGNLLMPKTRITGDVDWIVPNNAYVVKINYVITSAKKWQYFSNRQSIVSKIDPSTKYTIHAGSTPVYFHILSSYTRPTGIGQTDVSSQIVDGGIRIEANSTYVYDAPSNANYIVYNLYNYTTPSKVVIRENEMLDDYVNYQHDIIKHNTTFYPEQLLFTANDVNEGDMVYFDLTTASIALSCFVALFDNTGQRLVLFGRTASSDTEYHKTGYIMIPRGFSYAIITGYTDVSMTINALRVDNSHKEIDVYTYQQTAACISDTTWVTTSINNRKGVFIHVDEGDTFGIEFDRNSYYGFLRSSDCVVDTPVNFAQGCKRVTLTANNKRIIQAPQGAKYLFIQTNLSNTNVAVSLEKLPQSAYTKASMKSSQAEGLLQNAVVMSNNRYLYAFAPQISYIDNHVKCVFAGNENTTDGDATINTNVIVCADYDVMTGDVTSTERTPITSFVDGNGNALSGITRHYNTLYPQYGNDIGMFTPMGNGTSNTFSFGFNQSLASNTLTRCKLSYNNTTVEFTIENYRQMLVDMGYASTYVAPAKPTQDNTNIYYTDGLYYIVMCGHIVGTSSEFPLVLISSPDLETWTVVRRLGTKTHKACEISMTIIDGVTYLCYRYQLDRDGTTSGNYGYRLCAYDSAGTELYDIFKNSYIISCPIVFQVNGKVWCGYNELPNIDGGIANFTHPNGRQQMAFYRMYKDGVDYAFSVENPTGINYPWSLIVPRLDDNQTPVKNLDRLYFAFTEDRRNLKYRQVGNVSLSNMTSIFG